MNWTFGPGQLVAAAAVVAADEAVVREITGHHYDVTALVIPATTPNWPTLLSLRC